MKKTIFIIGLLAGILPYSPKLYATAPAVAVTIISTAGYQDSIAARYIYTAVTRTLYLTKGFNILDVANWKQTIIEMTRQQDIHFLQQPIVEKGKSVGATILVIGLVKNAQIYCKRGHYGIRVDYDLNFIDVATDILIATVSIKCGDQGLYNDSFVSSKGENTSLKYPVAGRRRRAVYYSQADTIPVMSESVKNSIRGLMIDVIESTTGSLNNWVRSKFDLNLLFLNELEQDRKKRMRSILIEGGSDIGMQDGQLLALVLETKYKTATDTIYDHEIIAWLKVTEVRPQTSTCKVMKGKSPSAADTAQHLNYRVIFQ